MRPDHSDLKYVWDMLDAAQSVVEWTTGRTLADYEQTKWLRMAVERSIEIIGEAARHVSDNFKTRHPAVPWQPIIATRHIFAHEYSDLKHDKVWRIATTHIPALIPLLQPILDANPPEAPGAQSIP